MVLVESIPQHMKYKGNVTLGLPLGEAWKELLSMATEQVDVASFYWTLTGEDINVNSSSDEPVSCSAARGRAARTRSCRGINVDCVPSRGGRS